MRAHACSRLRALSSLSGSFRRPWHPAAAAQGRLCPLSRTTSTSSPRLYDHALSVPMLVGLPRPSSVTRGIGLGRCREDGLTTIVRHRFRSWDAFRTVHHRAGFIRRVWLPGLSQRGGNSLPPCGVRHGHTRPCTDCATYVSRSRSLQAVVACVRDPCPARASRSAWALLVAHAAPPSA